MILVKGLQRYQGSKLEVKKKSAYAAGPEHTGSNQADRQHSVYITVLYRCRAQHTRFEIKAVRWQSGSGSIAEKSSLTRLSYSRKSRICDGCIGSALWSTRLYLEGDA